MNRLLDGGTKLMSEEIVGNDQVKRTMTRLGWKVGRQMRRDVVYL